MRRISVGKYLGSMVFGCAMTATPLLAAPSGSDAETVIPAVAVQQVSVPSTELRDQAGMVLVGTALIGLAAAVRRAA